MNYDVLIIGAGPGGIFSAYELSKLAPSLKVGVFEAGNPLNKRKCPIDGKKIKNAIKESIEKANLAIYQNSYFTKII